MILTRHSLHTNIHMLHQGRDFTLGCIIDLVDCWHITLTKLGIREGAVIAIDSMFTPEYLALLVAAAERGMRPVAVPSREIATTTRGNNPRGIGLMATSSRQLPWDGPVVSIPAVTNNAPEPHGAVSDPRTYQYLPQHLQLRQGAVVDTTQYAPLCLPPATTQCFVAGYVEVGTMSEEDLRTYNQIVDTNLGSEYQITFKETI